MFVPNRVIFEEGSLDYPLGQKLYKLFSNDQNLDIVMSSTMKIKSHIPGDDLAKQYREGKKTLVVGLKKSLKFQTCKPSAHYQLPLVSGCMGQCEYCYLNTQLGDKPFVKIHVNLDAIFQTANDYMLERLPDTTIFEGAATSDPVPVEPYTHTLENCIQFFASKPNGRFRFVTKYTDIDSLCGISHNNHTEIRFSLNTEKIISTYEHATSSAKKRIEASCKLAESGYPIGFIIAPVFIYENWQEDYHNLLLNLKQSLPQHTAHPIIFEVISHRYTTKAKNRIVQIFPNTLLPMEDFDRTFKYGQFGYGKYVYPNDNLIAIKTFFQTELDNLFPNKIIKYII